MTATATLVFPAELPARDESTAPRPTLATRASSALTRESSRAADNAAPSTARCNQAFCRERETYSIVAAAPRPRTGSAKPRVRATPPRRSETNALIFETKHTAILREQSIREKPFKCRTEFALKRAAYVKLAGTMRAGIACALKCQRADPECSCRATRA